MDFSRHNKKLIIFFIILVLYSFVVIPDARAEDGYTIDPDLSNIKGSIRYTVVGRYNAVFEDFSGVLYFDPNNVAESSVTLKIKTASIKSAFPVLDNIVRSGKLLDVQKYPDTIFQSKVIKKAGGENEYIVIGDLTLTGVTREITFPFTVDGPHKDSDGGIVNARGVWVINRKDFDIYWNSLLDRAGILVGNHMIVDWEIYAGR